MRKLVFMFLMIFTVGITAIIITQKEQLGNQTEQTEAVIDHAQTPEVVYIGESVPHYSNLVVFVQDEPPAEEPVEDPTDGLPLAIIGVIILALETIVSRFIPTKYAGVLDLVITVIKIIAENLSLVSKKVNNEGSS